MDELLKLLDQAIEAHRTTGQTLELSDWGRGYNAGYGDALEAVNKQLELLEAK